MTLLDNRSPLTSSSRHRRRDLRPPTHEASSHPRRQDFFLAQRIQGRPCFKEAANLLRKTLQLIARLLQHVQLSHKPTRATIPKTGRRGDDLANRLDRTSYFASILSQRPFGSREQQAISRSCCRTRRMELKSIFFSPLDSSPRSRRTEVVARWRWSPLLWRFCRWELSHRRLLLCASPRMRDTTWARHRRPRSKRHPCKGDQEVRLSRRN